MCQDCLLDTHRLLPDHKVEKWAGECFVKASLKEADYVLYLGHQGSPCPKLPAYTGGEGGEEASGSGSGDNVPGDQKSPLPAGVLSFTVVDVTGIFEHHVHFCTCPGADEQWQQLLKMSLFPATMGSPRTAFTFACLDYFDLDFMECKTPAMSFMAKQARLSNSLFPYEVKVCNLFLEKDFFLTP